MEPAASACPDVNALLRVAQGTSDDGELSAVELHLDGCESCRRALAAAASGGAGQPGRGPAPRLGERVGRYTVEALLGAGGMGLVYAARDPDLDRRVALKLLRNPDGDQATARLRREAQAMARLAHAHVVPVFELGAWEGRLFLAMELVEGDTLAGLARRGASRPELLRAMVESARGLAAAHAAGVVHRDFKPANVLMGPDGRARVTDFGLARPEGSAVGPTQADDVAALDLTRTGALLGTPAYMAPEQLAGQPADARSDQFAWCVALVELVAGRRPFEGDGAAALAAAMPRGPRLDGVPRSLRRVVARGLALDPAARFPSMQALLAALESAQRRWRQARVALGAAVLASLVAAGVGLMRWRRAPKPIERSQLTLHVDENLLLDEPNLERMAIGDPETVDGRPVDHDQVLLLGLKPGSTHVLLWFDDDSRRQIDVQVQP
jgi:serine/threonine-protein kinase